MTLEDPPELVALCRQSEDGLEEVAGWAMVLADHVVGCGPNPVIPSPVLPSWGWSPVQSRNWRPTLSAAAATPPIPRSVRTMRWR